MAAKVPSWIERLLLPRLSSIEGELKGFRGEVGGEFKAVQGEFDAVHSEIKRLDERIDSLRNEVLTRFDGLEKRLDFAKDFGVLQARVTELEARLPKA